MLITLIVAMALLPEPGDCDLNFLRLVTPKKVSAEIKNASALGPAVSLIISFSKISPTRPETELNFAPSLFKTQVTPAESVLPTRV